MWSLHMNSGGELTIGSREKVQSGSCTPRTSSNVEIKSEVYGTRSSYHPWAAFRKKHKHETKVDLSFTLILKTNSVRVVLFPASPKNFRQIFTFPSYVNFLLCLLCFSAMGIRLLYFSLSLSDAREIHGSMH